MAQQEQPGPDRPREESDAFSRQSKALNEIDEAIRSDEPAGEKLKKLVEEHSEACDEIKEELAGHKEGTSRKALLFQNNTDGRVCITPPDGERQWTAASQVLACLDFFRMTVEMAGFTSPASSSPVVEMAGFASPAPSSPAVGMAGFASPASSSPVVEMAGFANRKYRPTVSRSIPSSRAIRRRDQPRSLKL